MTQERHALQQAIENLYAVFEPYTPRERVHGCPCCNGESRTAALHGKPLREVEVEALRQYLPSAMTTWGTEENFKYFVPRLFEWLADDPGFDFGFYGYLLPNKMLEAGWPEWPAVEHRTVETFLMALWRCVLTSFAPYPTGYWSGGMLGVIAELTHVNPFLEAWRRDESAAALRHLSSFVYSSLIVQAENVVVRPASGMTEVRRWILDDPTLEKLENGYLENMEAEWACHVAETAGYLRRAKGLS